MQEFLAAKNLLSYSLRSDMSVVKLPYLLSEGQSAPEGLQHDPKLALQLLLLMR
jgi:hypothetical protein